MGETELTETELRPPTSAQQGFILRTVGADGLLGILDRSALREVAIWVEPPESALGLHDTDRQTSTDCSPDGGLGEFELSVEIYGLRRWCRAAMAGNLEMLLPLYAPEEQVLLCTDAGAELRRQTDAFLAAANRERLVREVTAACERVARMDLPVSPALRSLLEDLLGDGAEPGKVAGLARRIGSAPVPVQDPPPAQVLERWMIRTYRERWDATWSPNRFGPGPQPAQPDE